MTLHHSGHCARPLRCVQSIALSFMVCTGLYREWVRERYVTLKKLLARCPTCTCHVVICFITTYDQHSVCEVFVRFIFV